MHYRYSVVLEQGDDPDRTWGATVPDLPGRVSIGATRAEVLANVQEAIACHLEGLAITGRPIPSPGMYAVEVEGEADITAPVLPRT